MNITQHIGSVREKPLTVDAFLLDTVSVPDGVGGQIADDRGLVLLNDQHGNQRVLGLSEFEQTYEVVHQGGAAVAPPAESPSQATPDIAAGAPTTYPASGTAEAVAPAAAAPATAPTLPEGHLPAWNASAPIQVPGEQSTPPQG